MKDKNRNKVKITVVGEKGSSAMARPFPDIFKKSISEI
jgi:hypothetical protein